MILYRLLLGVIGCICLLATVPAQPPAQMGVAQKGNTYAVVIGLSQYQNPAIPPLTYAHNDAAVFSDYLQSPAGGMVAPERIKLLQNGNATIAAIYDAFDWLKENCKENDLAYLYFAGHGDVETRNHGGLGYLLAYNSPNNNYRNNAIRIEDLNDCANVLSIRNKCKVVLMTDACHSGKLAGDFYKGKQLAAHHLKMVLNNEVRIASCAADEEAAEGIAWGGGRGVFSYYLLQGMKGAADILSDGTIQLHELSSYLADAFKNDRQLLVTNHRQRPVSDGNPNFVLATVHPATATRGGETLTQRTGSPLPFAPLAPQPIDYFFTVASKASIDTILHFNSYLTEPPDSLPSRMVAACIEFQKKLYKERSNDNASTKSYESYEVFSIDSLALLHQQLQKNKSVNERFREKFIQLVHLLGQDMINAYLNGDLAELEKRQYYHAGTRQYNDYLDMLQLAIQLVPPTHSLGNLLKVHQQYLGGLIYRLQMTTSDAPAQLLQRALEKQHQALVLEPYAAYIHNELGNLYLHQRRLDSAEYHFKLASVLSPTWAIPWSNKIRLNLALDKPSAALAAVRMADSLQPNLSYVLTNGGLIKEKQKNLLAAESYYLKAISKNNVHFFPYLRLGMLYLATGKYKKANEMLEAAQTRRESFTLDDKQFEFGLELGGVQYDAQGQYKDTCSWLLPDIPVKWEPYLNLWKALEMQADTTVDHAPVEKMLLQILEQEPSMPLVHHYLGKELVRQRRWKDATPVLQQSIARQQPNSQLFQPLIQALSANKEASAYACLLHQLQFYQYDHLDDHYLLALALENESAIGEAIQQYKIIARQENQRQLNQANYTGYPAGKTADNGSTAVIFSAQLMEQFERPVAMIGAIKAARLYEQVKNYAAAEATLLEQVRLNRQAGDARQAAIKKRTPGTWQLLTGSTINFYWLNINRALEIETYNFYDRLTTLLPRDGAWKEKAGLFLYQRLALSLRNLPVQAYAGFYASVARYAYPWTGNEEPHDTLTLAIAMPGTGSELTIHATAYDPFTQAIQYLQQSIRLSGETQPPATVITALADLHAWTGKSEEAIRLYRMAVDRQPANRALRNKEIAYLTAQHELPGAHAQLGILHKRWGLKGSQLTMLAQGAMLSGNYALAARLFTNCTTLNQLEQAELVLLKAVNYQLMGQLNKALKLLSDSFPILPVVTLYHKDYEQSRTLVAARLYSMARLYAQKNQPSQAMGRLQQALQSGFDYPAVLEEDLIWEKLRETDAWNKMISSHIFEPIPDEENYTPNPITYWIPGFQNNNE